MRHSQVELPWGVIGKAREPALVNSNKLLEALKELSGIKSGKIKVLRGSQEAIEVSAGTESLRFAALSILND